VLAPIQGVRISDTTYPTKRLPVETEVHYEIRKVTDDRHGGGDVRATR
jgi:hypothetical protein